MLHLPRKNEPEVLQVLRLPRKKRGGAQVINCRRTCADLYEGAPSAAPATQKEPEVLQVLHLPLKNEPEVLQVLRLPRKTKRRPK